MIGTRQSAARSSPTSWRGRLRALVGLPLLATVGTLVVCASIACIGREAEKPDEQPDAFAKFAEQAENIDDRLWALRSKPSLKAVLIDNSPVTVHLSNWRS